MVVAGVLSECAYDMTTTAQTVGGLARGEAFRGV